MAVLTEHIHLKSACERHLDEVPYLILDAHFEHALLEEMISPTTMAD